MDPGKQLRGRDTGEGERLVGHNGGEIVQPLSAPLEGDEHA